MSKYTAEQVRAHLCFNDSVITDTGRDMLREYAAHLAAQAEWPSEEDVRIAVAAFQEKEDQGDGMGPTLTYDDCMRAALQSVRPPVGVVSDEDVERACEADFGKDAWHALSYEQKSEMRRRQRSALESYASHHAPTKD